MCIGSSPKAPTPPPRAPEAAVAPQVATTPSRRTGDDESRRRRAGGTGAGTILTGSRGVQDGAATAPKTLLGQ